MNYKLDEYRGESVRTRNWNQFRAKRGAIVPVGPFYLVTRGSGTSVRCPRKRVIALLPVLHCHPHNKRPLLCDGLGKWQILRGDERSLLRLTNVVLGSFLYVAENRMYAYPEIVIRF